MKKFLLRKVFPVLLTAVLLFLLCSCGAKNVSDNSTMNYYSQTTGSTVFRDEAFDGGMMPEAEYEIQTEESKSKESPMSPVETGIEAPQNTRKIIYSSWYNISTEEYDKSIAALDALCEKYGAYYENAETYGDKSEYSNRHASFTIRIPAQNYKQFISLTGTLGTVTGSGQNNQDVTERYFDTEARLESALLREERILEILKNASSLDDVLLLERELSDVRYEIENYQGTLKKYDSLISYSTATVRIDEVKKILPPDSQKQTLSQRMTASVNRGFDNFRSDLDDCLVSLSYNLPVIIFVWLPFILIAIVVVVIAKAKIRKKREAGKVPAKTSVEGETADKAETK